MSFKGLSVKLEKDLQKTTEGFESLFKSVGEFVESSVREIIETVVAHRVSILEEAKESLKAAKTGKAPKKAAKKKATKPATKKTPKKSASVSGDGRGRPSGHGLKEALVVMLKEKGQPLTEAEIADRLLEDPDKYKWNKNESTLYQTLPRAVQENLISDSGRDKKTKTYQVA